MDKWNEQAAPNNNLSAADVNASKLTSEHEFSEEISDGMERNQNIERLKGNSRE